MKPAFQLILLPGLGADQRLLEPQRQAFPHLLVPPWISPMKKEPLPEYAARMAAALPQLTDVPTILGGVSFGGMLAYEMARHLKPRAVVLIASCCTRQGLRRAYRAGRVLLPLIPVQAWSIAKLLAGPAVNLRTDISRQRRDLAVTMFREMDSRFMHWVLRAILHWRPSSLEGTPVYHIHGRRDCILPARCVAPDKVIADGGHLINVTHAAEVNSFIQRVSEVNR